MSLCIKSAYDFMAERHSHCLYHIGYKQKNPSVDVYLHASSIVNEAEQAFGTEEQHFFFVERRKMYLLFLRDVFCGARVEIVGAHLRQLLLLFPLLVLFGRRVTIHMHGQAYGLRKLGLKFSVWWILSKFTNLVVSNPAWQGPEFVKKIDNIHDIDVSLSGQETKGLFEQSIRTGGDVITYQAYVDGVRKASELKIAFDDEYYLYSPSGRISEAKIFGKRIEISAQDAKLELMAQGICDAYGVKWTRR